MFCYEERNYFFMERETLNWNDLICEIDNAFFDNESLIIEYGDNASFCFSFIINCDYIDINEEELSISFPRFNFSLEEENVNNINEKIEDNNIIYIIFMNNGDSLKIIRE